MKWPFIRHKRPRFKKITVKNKVKIPIYKIIAILTSIIVITTIFHYKIEKNAVYSPLTASFQFTVENTNKINAIIVIATCTIVMITIFNFEIDKIAVYRCEQPSQTRGQSTNEYDNIPMTTAIEIENYESKCHCDNGYKTNDCG